MRDYPVDAVRLDMHSIKMARRGLLATPQVSGAERDDRCLCGLRFVAGEWKQHVCKLHKEDA